MRKANIMLFSPFFMLYTFELNYVRDKLMGSILRMTGIFAKRIILIFYSNEKN